MDAPLRTTPAVLYATLPRKKSRWGKAPKPIIYPVTDGKPMAHSPIQWRIIGLLVENLEYLYRDAQDVWVGKDQFWYPTEKEAYYNLAPDVFVVFGRPNVERNTYQQWLENGVAPQVVIEVLSPSNRRGEMLRKKQFYQKHGVEEYYVIDPQFKLVPTGLEITLRVDDGTFHEIKFLGIYTSPRMNITFEVQNKIFAYYFPDGTPFLTHRQHHLRSLEEAARADKEMARADKEAARADEEAARAKEAECRAEEEARRADAYKKMLIELGFDPDSLIK